MEDTSLNTHSLIGECLLNEENQRTDNHVYYYKVLGYLGNGVSSEVLLC